MAQDAELQTSPDQETTDWPKGVPFIIGNEACERFSYYGMKAILYVHLVNLVQMTGATAEVAKSESTSAVHLFNGAVYLFPMLGAILADRYWGKFRTIFWVSMMYCVGHGLLALADLAADPGLRLYVVYAGLACIAIGAGGIKPCVSANVGDQFGRGNWFRVRTMFQIFYFSINFGSVFATLLIPQIYGDGKETWQVSLAFGLPGILMAIATFFFWWGKGKYVHIPPKPAGRLGALDTAAGALMFTAIGHFLVTKVFLPWWAMIIVSILFFAAGMAVFVMRQNEEQDDGFLAILVYTLQAHLKGDKGDAPQADVEATGAVAGEASSAAVPGAEAKDGEESSPVLRSSFWAPAVKRFGVEAAEGPPAVFKVITIFAFIPVFWAIFDQHSSTWIEQAKHMNRLIPLPWESFTIGYSSMIGTSLLVAGVLIGASFKVQSDLAKVLLQWVGGILGVSMIMGSFMTGGELTIPGEWNVKASQVPALNPAMVMILIVVMNYVYKGSEKVGYEMTPLRRMTIGMFVAGASFAIAALLQGVIDADSLAAATKACADQGLQAMRDAAVVVFNGNFPTECEVWAKSVYAEGVSDALASCNAQGIEAFRSIAADKAMADFPGTCELWVADETANSVQLREAAEAARAAGQDVEIPAKVPAYYSNYFYSVFQSPLHIGWQVIAYLVLTTSEVMVSITALEFAYTQAPKRMKSTVMGLFLFTVTLGNFIVFGVVELLPIPTGGTVFFWIFAIAAFITGALLGVRSLFYKIRDFPQE